MARLYPRTTSAIKREAREIVNDVLEWFGQREHAIHVDVVISSPNHATYHYDGNRIEICQDSWMSMDTFQRRILIIHELLHHLGMDHDIKKHYSTIVDLLSVQAYIRIYGNDDVMELSKTSCNDTLNDIKMEATCT